MPVAIISALKSKFSSFIDLAWNWIQRANSTEPISTDLIFLKPFQAILALPGSPLGSCSQETPWGLLGAGAALNGASQPIQVLCLQQDRDTSAFEAELQV